MPACGARVHALPQKIVKTSTAEMSGPLRYVSRAAGAGAIAVARWSGTIRIGSWGAAAVWVGVWRTARLDGLDLAMAPGVLHDTFRPRAGSGTSDSVHSSTVPAFIARQWSRHVGGVFRSGRANP